MRLGWVYIRMRRDESLQREAVLNAKTYSRRDERRILDVLGRGLLKDFPNPERVGCPGAEVLKRIASHEMPLSEAEKWLDHLGSCSPCYADFKRLQEAHESRQRRAFLAAAAGVLLAITLAGWAWLHKRSEDLLNQTAVIDLRDRSIARGTEENPGEQPLQLSRRASQVTILLPTGSSQGPYEIRIAAPSGEAVAASDATAEVRNQMMSVRMRLSLASIRPGKYLLQLRRPGINWQSYSLVLR